MAKLDELMKASRGVAVESMGAGPGAMHRASPPAPTPTAPAHMQGIKRSSNAAEIPIDRIVPDPDQPRQEFEAESLGRLAASMKAKGQLQPVRVRWDEGRGAYVLVCGERRWRAARLAGFETLSCVFQLGPI